MDPRGEEIRTPARAAQEQYIVDYLNHYGTALNGANFRDPTTGYAAYFDVPAGIDHHILNVFSFNVDALRLSTHLHKPRNGKITFGPLWYFDRALGLTDGRDANPRVCMAQGGRNSSRIRGGGGCSRILISGKWFIGGRIYGRRNSLHNDLVADRRTFGTGAKRAAAGI